MERLKASAGDLNKSTARGKLRMTTCLPAVPSSTELKSLPVVSSSVKAEKKPLDVATIFKGLPAPSAPNVTPIGLLYAARLTFCLEVLSSSNLFHAIAIEPPPAVSSAIVPYFMNRMPGEVTEENASRRVSANAEAPIPTERMPMADRLRTGLRRRKRRASFRTIAGPTENE